MATFAFDLDGTICFGGSMVAPIILDALDELASRHQVIIASARHPVNMLDVMPAALFAQLDVVGANGAIAYAAGVRVHACIMGVPIVRSVLEALEAARCAYLAYGEDFVILSADPHAMHVAITRDLDHKLRLGTEADLGRVLKVLALPSEELKVPLLMCKTLVDTRIQPHSDGTFDVMRAGVDKAVGIRALLTPGMPLFAAFGNDTNDLAMLTICQHPVTVGEHPALKHLGGHRISLGPDQEDQIATVIRLLSQSPEVIEQ